MSKPTTTLATALLFLNAWPCLTMAGGFEGFLECGGRVAMKAEHFTDRSPRPDPMGEQNWLIIDTEGPGIGNFNNASGEGFDGLYIQALPDHITDTGPDPNSESDGPTVDYLVRLNQPGQYRLFLRFDGFSDNSDTVYGQIVELMDGLGGQHADWYRFNVVWDQNFNTDSWIGDGGPELSNSSAAQCRRCGIFRAPVTTQFVSTCEKMAARSMR